MSGRDRIQRGWTHRRLGIGGERISELALAETDAMLTSVGARHMATTSGFGGADPFNVMLLDFVCDLDRMAGVAEVDATPVATELLRLKPVSRRTKRLTWRVLVPAMSGSLAALVVVLTMLLVRTSSTPAPSLSATTESQQLLSHADSLLAAAAAATAPADRTRLLTEAKADLRHVTRLLPLAPPPDRPEIRQRLHALDRRVPPPAPATHQQVSGGSVTNSGSGTQARRQPPQHRQPVQPVNSESTTSSDSQPTVPQTIPPPRPDAGEAPPPQGARQGAGGQPPPARGQSAQ